MAYCPGEPVFTQTTNEVNQTFRLDTAALCGTQAEETNICDVNTIDSSLTLAMDHIQEAINEFDDRVMIRRSQCNIHPMDISIASGHSLANTLRNGMDLISDIALNLTILSCNSGLNANLFRPMQTVLCEMKRLCSSLIQSGAFDIVKLEIDSMDRTDLRIFTCRNLRKAHTLLHHFKRDLNSDRENVPAYSDGD